MFQSIYNSLFTTSQDIIALESRAPSGIRQTIAGNHKVGFDDICHVIKSSRESYCLLINTLPINEQENLIKNTIPYQMEETIINNILTNRNLPSYTIIVYGRNSADDMVDKKFKQLQQLGFVNVFIYYGGLFEWMLLQDVYGAEYFPTTMKERDILKYMAKRKL
jgi:hypothetical protein